MPHKARRHTDAQAYTVPDLFLVALLMVELGLEAKGLALILCQLVGLPRFLLPLPLKVVQPETMAGEQDSCERRCGAAAGLRGGLAMHTSKRTHAHNSAGPHEAPRAAPSLTASGLALCSPPAACRTKSQGTPHVL